MDDILRNNHISAVNLISGIGFINFGNGDIGTDTGNRITSSLVIQVDDVSIVVVAYTFSMTSFFVGFVSGC